MMFTSKQIKDQNDEYKWSIQRNEKKWKQIKHKLNELYENVSAVCGSHVYKYYTRSCQVTTRNFFLSISEQ